MLLVRTKLKESTIDGLGVFSDEFIPEGEIIWKFEPLVDRLIEEKDIDTMPAHIVEFLDHYCEYFPELGLLVLSGDHDRFTNHSETPNTRVLLPNGPQALVVAARDIAPGEELTCDYGVVRSRKWNDLGQQTHMPNTTQGEVVAMLGA